MLRILGLSVLLVLAANAGAATLRSAFDPQLTAERYVQALQRAEVPVLERRRLPDGEEIVFPSPVYGTRIGQCHKGMRKDKPLRTRIWRDPQGRVWLRYSEPRAKINEFGVIECGNEVDQVRRALDAFATTATSP